MTAVAVRRRNFRAAWTADVAERAADLAVHLALAWFLPHGWMQFVPDLLVPALWLHGMVTDRYLDDWSLPVQAHRALHLQAGLLPALLLLAVAVPLSPWLAVHALAHAGVDSFTHDNWRDR